MLFCKLVLYIEGREKLKTENEDHPRFVGDRFNKQGIL